MAEAIERINVYCTDEASQQWDMLPKKDREHVAAFLEDAIAANEREKRDGPENFVDTPTSIVLASGQAAVYKILSEAEAFGLGRDEMFHKFGAPTYEVVEISPAPPIS